MSRWNDARLSRDRQREMKRNALLREAGRAFKQNGFHQTTLDDIAKALNVTKGALYHYVRNKHDILYRCHEWALELGDEALAHAQAEGIDGAGKVEVLVRHLVENLTGDLGEIAVLTEVEALHSEHRQIIQRRCDKFDRAFRKILEEGISDGSIRRCDARMAEFWIMGALNWIPKWYSPGGEQTTHELAAKFSDFVINGVGAKGGRDG